MHQRIKSLQDWIVVADSDEFYDFDALGPSIQVSLPVQQTQRHIVSASPSSTTHTGYDRLCRAGTVIIAVAVLRRSTSAGLKPRMPASAPACWWTGELQSSYPSVEHTAVLLPRCRCC